MPPVGSGIRIDGENRGEEKVISVTIRVANVGIPRRAIADSNKHLIIHRIVNNRVPSGPATTVGHPGALVSPSLVSHLGQYVV